MTEEEAGDDDHAGRPSEFHLLPPLPLRLSRSRPTRTSYQRECGRRASGAQNEIERLKIMDAPFGCE
jgi:hypothetical protein